MIWNKRTTINGFAKLYQILLRKSKRHITIHKLLPQGTKLKLPRKLQTL